MGIVRPASITLSSYNFSVVAVLAVIYTIKRQWPLVVIEKLSKLAVVLDYQLAGNL